MASPDLPPYVDLSLYDVTAAELIDLAIANLGVNLPGLVLREGMTESVLIEALAQIGNELIFAINRTTAATFAGTLSQFGVDRDPGAPAQAAVEFHAGDALGHLIPAGSQVALDLGDDELVIFATDEDLTIGVGLSVGVVSATATTVGAAANGVAVGTPLQVISAVPFINGAEISGSPVGGRDLEADVDFYARGRAAIALLTATLTIGSQFEQYALTKPEVYRAKALEPYNPAATGAPGSGSAHYGHVTVALMGPGGVALSGAFKTALEAEMTDRSLAGLTVHVVDATLNSYAVTVHVRRTADAVAADVQAAVTAAVGAYLDPDTWPWRRSMPYPDLSAAIDRVPGVDYVTALATAPVGDVDGNGLPVMTGYAPLVVPGVITVVVEDPL